MPCARRVRQKQTEWAERLERFRESGLTISRFCEAEQVSQGTFYQWKRRLGSPSNASLAEDSTGRSKPPAFQTIEVRQSHRGGRATIVRLGSDVEIELGDELQVVDQVIATLTKHRSLT